MKIFHFDFNTAFFNREYLENFIRRLKEWGYDTLLWELEDFVRWDTLKYCFQSDSISKNEMAEILNFTEELGFSNIPLVQCLGHCEYVLSCKEYAHMADAPGKIAPYCPQNPQVQDFLKNLLKEYMELFSKSKYIHLGCDEVWGLGDDCPECQKVIAAGGKETLLAQHINFLNSFVRNNGREAMIWADMLLIHPHGVQMLDKNIIMVDWRYELRSDRNMLWLWDEKGGHLIDESEITEDMRRNFGRYLYKNGKLNIFYTVDFLLDSGFRVISAGASSSYPDNFILGQTVDHICNACSMMQKSCECMGYLHTSWTVHCFAYEFQPAIEMVRMTDDFEAVMDEYADRHFGISGERFFSLLELLEGRMLFAYAGSTGHGKAQKEPPENIINIRLKDYEDAGLLESELERVYQFYDNYTRALSGLQDLRGELKRGHELFDNYIFAAEILKNRAEFVIFAISEYLQIPHSIDCNAVKEKLQKLSEKYYQDCCLRYTPAHAKRFVRIIFGTLVEYLNLQKI